MNEDEPVTRAGEGPHRFPGVEAVSRGEEFFSSDCSFDCGAYLTGSTSMPASDRRVNWGHGYGDRRGVGSCPNNPMPSA